VCGIAGCVLAPGRTPDRAALERMGDAIAHRGPDDHGVAVLDNVGLVHRRLSIVDPSPAGHQPMATPDGRWWLTYNGEVYNHAALRMHLDGVAWRGGTDSETLLHALARWGDEAVPRCNGLFAFAALDTARRRLLLVRDRWGIKPLYYARHDGGLWFASEIRALLAAGLPGRADPALLHDAVGAGWLNAERTWVHGVFRVLPGRMLAVSLDDGTVAERAWYDPADVVDPACGAELAALDRDAARARLEEELRTSVRRRLMADVPVGSMCSGGLDSSVVTAFARDEHPDIRAYNAAMVDHPEADEGPWAERVAEALGIELRTVRMTAEDWRAGFVATALHNEHPLVHESSVPMAALAHLAHADGVKVLLSGEGADELLGGYEGRHRPEYRDWDRRAHGPEGLARGLYRRVRPAPRVPRVDAERAYEDALRARARRAYRHHRGARRRLEAELLVDLRTYLPHLLNRQDKNTMQHAIETRVPFLDKDLVRVALNLPLEARVEPERKGLLREIGARVLPAEVARRPKVGFGFDLDRYAVGARPGFLGDGALREALQIAREPWAEGVRELRGQRLMLALSAEVLLRGLLGGSPAAVVERELWG
jgi:asparagine synthase (glutamine-hydrolysing)